MTKKTKPFILFQGFKHKTNFSYICKILFDFLK